MKSTLSQCALSLWDTIKAPLIRHECDHRCGIYKNRKSTDPLASFEIHRDSSISLIKLIAMIGSLVFICFLVKKMCARIKNCCVYTCASRHFKTKQ